MNWNKLNYLNRTINWIHNHISAKQFLILSSILVGLAAGLAAVILKFFAHSIKHYVIDQQLLSFDLKYLYLFFPLIGICITVFIVQQFFQGKLDKGTTNILFSVAKKGSFLPFSQMYSHILTSAVTVGFGGSAGLESPIVSTGSAIGSNFAQRYKLSYKDRTLLLAAGAAGGIAGAFDAPIAGVLFALEVLLIDINITAFVPLLIASASGALISKIILQENILLSFNLRQPFDYHNVPYYVVLGLLAGAVSIYHVSVFDKVENRFARIKSSFWRCILGGISLAVILAFFPSFFGEGYDSIKSLAEVQPNALFEDSVLTRVLFEPTGSFFLILLAMLLKAVAVGITLGSGGNGGNFAPSLFVGAHLGFVFANFLILLGFDSVPVGNLTLVAMAGILSGTFHAPLTGIFLIAEITGGYELIIPLMIVSSISFAVVKYFHPDSLEIKRLKKRGTIISEDRDTNILGKISIQTLIERDYTTVQPEDTLGVIVDRIKHSKKNMYPVVNINGELRGIIFLDDIKEEMFNQNLYDKTSAKELMVKHLTKISATEDIFSVMLKFERSGHWELPVTLEGKYLGFLSKSSVLAQYRNELLGN